MVEMRFEPLCYMLLNGLIQMAHEAWMELEDEHKDVNYSPDWEAYQRMEDRGILRFISLREDGRLIGYASIISDHDIHRMNVRFASFRDIFITRSKRGYAARFVRFIEKHLSDLGIDRVWIGERIASGNKSGRFYEAMGYFPQELIYGKNLNSRGWPCVPKSIN